MFALARTNCYQEEMNLLNARIWPSLSIFILALILPSAFGKTSAAKVTFSSACVTKGNHAADRWTPKTDASPIPANKSAIKKITPSQIVAWPGLSSKEPMTRKTQTRLAREQQWYELTGKVVDVRVEADGDIHVALQDVSGKIGRVGVEVPVGPRWCKIRQSVFSWTNATFPFAVQSNKVFKITKPHVIAVTGKAFYDIDHAPKDHSNRSTIHPNTAVWEVHPVAALQVIK
jgi:hypothetical protein